ncbi:flagellar biosynthetic protein FliO [Nitratidesulfovibrio liaohensis]|uniref:Flagellar protein n=1 Tax=Nitratidesulfovibrio liaohensis TaxID=2604158 RepID=A0ABY9QY87_9BACT|nr:flagellar biosynthetic protein FliO [Nitratidesulfovibrio liaohensis]WMW64505.1 flagellar biosynthetic protein FliO [Nitratidesulfovibrio liaohensis]
MLNATESAVGAATDMAAQASAQTEGAVRAAISANATLGDAVQSLPHAAGQVAASAANAVNATMATANATIGASDGLAAAAVPAFSWSGYIQAVGVLFLLVGLLWLALWAVRRHGGLFRAVPGAGGFSRDDLRLEAQLPIGPRKGLMVVRFLNKRLLLGVTDQQITLLTEQDLDHEHGSDDATSDAGSLSDQPGGRGSGGFSSVLGRALGKGRAPSGN